MLWAEENSEDILRSLWKCYHPTLGDHGTLFLVPSGDKLPQRQSMPNVEAEPYSDSDDIGVLSLENGVDFPQ